MKRKYNHLFKTILAGFVCISLVFTCGVSGVGNGCISTFATTLTTNGDTDSTDANSNIDSDTASDSSTNTVSGDAADSSTNTTETAGASSSTLTDSDANAAAVTATATDEDGNIVYTTADVISDPDAPEISAKCCIVMDANTGTILYAKNAYDRCYPASITKVMTCLVAMENTDLDSTVTFSEDAIWGIERDSNHIALDVGEQITAEQCFYAILLQSANEASWGMAEHVAGSLSAFADMMNAKAEELGCKDTHFVNANGLHDDDHYTTCYDMALITKAAMDIPLFRQIDSTIYYQIPATNICDEPRDLWHQLKMLYPSSRYYYEYLEGGKTGFTDQARHTLTTYAKKDDMELICVMMKGSSAADCYLDSATLYDYYFDNYTYAYPLKDFEPNVSDTDNSIVSNFYRGLDHDTFDLSVDSDLAVVVPRNLAEGALTTQSTYYDQIDGNVVGGVDILLNGEVIGHSDITYNELTVDGETLTWGKTPEEKKKTTNTTLIVAIICIVFVVVTLFIIAQVRNRRYRYLKRRSRNSKRKLHF